QNKDRRARRLSSIRRLGGRLSHSKRVIRGYIHFGSDQCVLKHCFTHKSLSSSISSLLAERIGSGEFPVHAPTSVHTAGFMPARKRLPIVSEQFSESLTIVTLFRALYEHAWSLTDLM
ncbi:MAG TPA: hypothetical protein VKQ36_12795, partial [Ktedonobacterales bacterium]|nr:hypothetical protein [Ktedonobacterales bacterium]